ncbi:MAG: hypothetical protein LBT71_00580 [Azoarcus sp.]|jgi:hypothetical protein|nr:hypothetical protein [Azoarcus sp.]
MENADLLLSRLEKVKQTGAGRWIARCPAHDDKGPSLSIRELDGGKILLHCFAGCDIAEITGAVGLEITDLFPPNTSADRIPGERGERRPFPASDVLRCIAFEMLVVMTAGATLLAGEPFMPENRNRLMLAVARIQAACNLAGVRHE